MKKKLIIFFIFLTVAFGVAGILGCRNKNETPPVEHIYVEPEIISVPTAGNIAVGESTDASVLSGEFSVEGELRFADEATYPNCAGTVVREWVFTPADTENYNSLNGYVSVNVYLHKLVFNENGGYEVKDVYFNESFTLENKPLTAKNEYRFEGWAQTDGCKDYIEYPATFTKSATLYADYRFHTAEKLYYKVVEDKLPWCYVEASWKSYWENRGEYEKAKQNTIPNYSLNDNYPEDAIEGEVIIADMFDGVFVTEVMSFAFTKINSIVFNNFTLSIHDFKNTLLESVCIPNTVKYIDYETFQFNSELAEVIYQDGESAVGYKDKSTRELEFEYKRRTMPTTIFYGCPNLKSVVFHNVKEVGSFFLSDIETIVIPAEAETIKFDAFYGCSELKEVIFEEGCQLKSIENRAFAHCTSLKKISVPEGVNISADAFYGCTALEEIDITDEQITELARNLHSVFIDGKILEVGIAIGYQIGHNDDFKVNIVHDEQYAGENAQGEYVAGTEEINLYIDKFSIHALTALCHEFFHHFQYVLCYGLNDESWNTVPCYNDVYFFTKSYMTPTNPPTVVIAKDKYESVREVFGVGLKSDYPEYLIDGQKIDDWKKPYIELKDDKSNFAEYWNQPYEMAAREFASWFTGLIYEKSFCELLSGQK